MLNPQQTVASLVLDHSETAPVFQRNRIDYCCRGDISLEAVAAKQGLELGALIAELEQAIAARSGQARVDMREMSTTSLVAHIVSKHHDYLRQSLPYLGTLSAKVARVHGDHNPKLREMDAALKGITEAMIPHLDMEEQVLFPAMMSKGDTATISAKLHEMNEEHLVVGSLLEKLRAASEDFTLPDWACNSYRTLFQELEHLEADILEHVHLENHVLEPRFA